MQKNTALLITCGVGYGHLAATMNIEQALRREDPNIHILHVDTRDYFPSFVKRVSDQWDSQMRKGHFSISQIVELQGPYELFYARFLDRHLSRDIAKLFQENHITAVYDMQPVLTAILYRAVAKACEGRTITYHKILTDLPTSRNQSYFTGIKQIRHVPHVPLKIHAPHPLLAPGETLESFWQSHCRLASSCVDTTYALPVNHQYLRAPQSPDVLHLAVNPEWELALPLPSHAHVTSLMLGSQGVNAIYDYATRYLEQLEAHQPDRPHYFFIACSKNQALYDSLRDLLFTHPLHRETPHRIIPLTMQTMDSVASLMWRSNQVIIRSGGISSLEQLAIAQGRKDNLPKLWIHSGYKGNHHEDLLKHTYSWERGNAEYLMHHLGAQMTAPQLIKFFE